MSLKKIIEKNPGFEFSAKASKKASAAVKETSLKSKLNIDSYNIKYTKQSSSSKDSLDEVQNVTGDKKWKFLKKTSTNKNMDFMEEPKGSFFDENGEEVVAED